MDINSVLTVLQTISVIAAIIVALGTIRGRNNEQVSKMTKLQSDVDYIKEKVDDMPFLRERLIQVESDVKMAHERIADLSNRVTRLENKNE